MFALAWANLTHHKLRSLLSALAVGIVIMLILVSRGLAAGSLAEVDQRIQSVDAELVVLPAQENIIFTNGAPFRRGHEQHLRQSADEHGPLAANVVPVFFGQVKMGGQQQRLFGVDPRQMAAFLGPRRILQGRLFEWAVLAEPDAPDRTGQRPMLPTELVIDERLQRVGAYHLGDEIQIMGQDFRIVGVVEAGVAGRVFAPLETLREIVVSGEPSASMYFLKLRAGLDPLVAAERFQRELGGDVRVELKSDYGRLLRDSFAQVNLYLNASSGVALVACFLFILLTMYTAIIERTREIGVLKALGVGRAGLIRLAIHEALLISLGGVALGLTLALAARGGLLLYKPLLTVDLELRALVLAVVIGVVGGVLSALYPGYRAARLDPALALSTE